MTSPAAGAARRPGTRFRILLLALVAGLSLPFLVLAAAAVWRAGETERERYEAQLLSTARALALAVDRELGQAAARLDTLAASHTLREGMLEQFTATVARSLPADASVVLYRPDGTMRLVATAEGLNAAATGQRSQALDFLRDAQAAGGLRISPVLVGSVSRQPRVLLVRPVEVRGEAHMLGLSMDTARLRRILEEQRIPGTWRAAVLDGQRRVVARTHLEAQFVGQPALPEAVRALEQGEGGLVRGIRTMDGILTLLAAARAPESGFAVGLAAPMETPWQQAARTLGPMMAVGLVLALAALLVALVLARRLIHALDRLGRSGGGQTGIAEVDEAAARLARIRAARDAANAALAGNEERARLTLEAFGGGGYDCRPGEEPVIRSPGMLALVGEAVHDGTAAWWTARIHPADKPAWDAATVRLFGGTDGIFEARYRVRHADGRWVHVWHRALALRDGEGVIRRMVGYVLDVSAEAQARQQAALVAREMDHRVKNSFALVAGLAAAAAADHPEAQDFADEMRERLRALAAAHDLSRQGQLEGGAAGLRALLARLARPYRDAVVVSGTDAPLVPEEVQPVALVVHEWLTNSVKHGALSRPGGRLAITLGTQGGEVALDWRESGGPPVSPPAQRGFGEELVRATVEAQLGGALSEDWRPDGLRLALRWPGLALRAEDAPARGSVS